jgi:serine/threonine-protein kinase SRK2
LFLKQVSAECRDLIARMLTVDPRDRISVADIQQHPWFQQDLPMGTLGVNTQLQQTDSARQATLPPPPFAHPDPLGVTG